MFGSKNDLEAVWRDGVKRSINRATIQERQLLEAFGDPETIPARIASRYVDLLEARVAQPAFHPNGAQRVLDLGAAVFALLRIAPDDDDRVLSLINVTAEDQTVRIPAAELGLAGVELVDLVHQERLHPHGPTLELTLAPYQVMWLKAV
jgi:sucrose phosphorylase